MFGPEISLFLPSLPGQALRRLNLAYLLILFRFVSMTNAMA